MDDRKDQIYRSLTKLQRLARAPVSDAELPSATLHPIPDDLAPSGDKSLVLGADGQRALLAAESALRADLRFEHLSRQDRASEALRRLVAVANLEPSQDHVPAFFEEFGREPEDRVCFIPVESLNIASPCDLFSVSFLPINDAQVPAEHPFFSLEPPVGSVIAVTTRGTDLGRMAERARAAAEQALRVLRVALRENRWLNGFQLRFRLAPSYTFGEGLAGFGTPPEAVWSVDLDHELLQLATSQPLSKLAEHPETGVERRAQLALKWIENAYFATDRVTELLFLFFALESILGDKAEGLKGAGLAFRRAMLSTAVRGSFADPGRAFWLYEKVRSAAVHGEVPPEIDSNLVKRFAWDVRIALNQYLEFATSNGLRKRGTVLRALREHPDTPRLVTWLRENAGPAWDSFLNDSDDLPTS